MVDPAGCSPSARRRHPRLGDAPTTAVAVSAVRLDGSERGFMEAQDIALEKARRSYRHEFGTDMPEAEAGVMDVSDEDDDEYESHPPPVTAATSRC